jgi:hypothetical protein
MPGTFSANGRWQIRMIETGSSTPYGLTAIQPYLVFFDQLQQSRTGGINTTYELKTQFKLYDIPVGTYYFQILQSPNFPSSTAALPVVTLDPGATTKSFLEITDVVTAADGRIMDIPSNMPYGTTGIKLIDFIKGVQKKFNLVIYPDKTKPNRLVVDTFNDWYKKGVRKDFNKYINLNEAVEVIPANNLAVNQLNFGDALDQDYVSQQFSKGANREFGKAYYTDTQNYFSQGTLEVKTTFASSPLLQIAGTGLSGSVEGAGGSQNPSFTIPSSLTAYNSALDACNGSPSFVNYYATSDIIADITTLFTDSQRTIPVNGNFFWYLVREPATLDQYAVQISNNGILINKSQC